MIKLQKPQKFWLWLLLGLTLGTLWACASEPEAPAFNRQQTVTATAYNSIAGQTNAQPTLTAFGDTLRPGMRAIAVSRDLIRQGLTHRTPVKIEGLPGTYLVLDKMAARWRNKIDLYLGVDRDSALAWGKREVVIHWYDPEMPGSNSEESP